MGLNRSLPVYELEQRLGDLCRSQPRLLVQAPTGSGKSTQVPQMLLEHGCAGSGRIVVLQPRRLAARMLAARVAAERGQPLGQEVGYQVRFERVGGRDTRIWYVTEGVLLRQMVADPRLPGVSIIILDEFHERHLYGDITLARAAQLQAAERPDLRLVVMSATLDADVLERYWPGVARLSAAGRAFPIEVEYAPRPVDFNKTPVWEAAAAAFQRLAPAGAAGDVLVFMPGSYEILRTIECLRALPAARGCDLLPLHGELSARDQDAAVAPAARRKIIVATNVAETSITIDGVTAVIDSGLARIARHDPRRGINTLFVEKISQASADQRAGRAGRTAPGRCLRLWTREEHAHRARQETPEIRRVDLAETLLTLKATGVEDVRAFPWLEAPAPAALDQAHDLLRDLGALDARDGLTPAGRRMVAFPAHPRYARMFLAAADGGCVREAALIAALSQTRQVLQRARRADVQEDRDLFLGDEQTSDFFLQMRAWLYADRQGYDLDKCRRLGIHAGSARQVRDLYRHFLRLAEQAGLPLNDQPAAADAVRKCLLAGFADQLAVRRDQGTLRCQLVHGRTAELARESAVRNARLVVAAEISEIGGRPGESRVALNLVTAVEEEWLQELFPDDFSTATAQFYDPQARRVCQEQRRMFRDLILESRAAGEADPAAAGPLLAEQVLAGRLDLPQWDAAVEQWVQRLNFLARWCPETGVRPLDAAGRTELVRQLCAGAVSFKELKDRQVWPLLHAWLGGGRHVLDREVPERLALPGGRHAKIQYPADPEQSPALAATIQDLYGLRETPRVAMRRRPVKLEILGPNRRPVQITEDLASFWAEAYPRIKKELQRKYPKHEWR